MPFLKGREREREREKGDVVQQRATGWGAAARTQLLDMLPRVDKFCYRTPR